MEPIKDNNQKNQKNQAQCQGSQKDKVNVQQKKQTKSLAQSRKGSQQLEKKAEDMKSVFVQNVDYAASKQELQILFQDCGTITRITILKDKFTNVPKGNAYISFQDPQSVQHALMISGTMLRNRSIKVSPKRTNIRGFSKKNGTFNKDTYLNYLSKGIHRRGR